MIGRESRPRRDDIGARVMLTPTGNWRHLGDQGDVDGGTKLTKQQVSKPTCPAAGFQVNTRTHTGLI